MCGTYFGASLSVCSSYGLTDSSSATYDHVSEKSSLKGNLLTSDSDNFVTEIKERLHRGIVGLRENHVETSRRPSGTCLPSSTKTWIQLFIHDSLIDFHLIFDS